MVEYCAEAVCPLVSFTKTLTTNVPAEGHVPVMTPVAEFKLRLGGKPVCDHV